MARASLPPRLLAAGLLAAVLSGCGPHRAPPPDPLPGAARSRPPTPAGAPAPPEPDQPPPGVFHRVVRGQTLYTIARTYGVALADIVEANELENPDRIEEGAMLLVPGAVEELNVPITVPGAPGEPGDFLLPVRGKIGSRYGPRGGRMHYGIDITAPAGTRVLAARDGVVLVAGSPYRGYGKLVILEHVGGLRTLYAHNRQLRTRAGKRVRAGDVIAEVGSTGNATGPHLHFEIRMDNTPLDPLPYLDLGSSRRRR